jgi:Transglycosylase SLT domain
MRALGPCLFVLLLGVPACAPGARSGMPMPAPRPAAIKPAEPVVNRKAPARVARVDSMALEFAVTARAAHLPLARAIAKRTGNPAVAERAAWAVTREAGRLKVSPSLLAAVLIIENGALDSIAVSSQGAVGLMQVMPIHAGSYGCASADLRTVDANVCHGARILHTYIVRTRSVPRALRRYNGCVRGSNTPGCHRYPIRVLRTAGRIRREILTAAPATRGPGAPGDQRAASGARRPHEREGAAMVVAQARGTSSRGDDPLRRE